jgi:two-component system CheB/CheR fusion protein
MQSLNEVADRKRRTSNKLSDFEQANNDMKNLLNSTEIATLLDKELNIRRFTDPVTKYLKSDPEMPDLVNDLNYPDMGVHET